VPSRGELVKERGNAQRDPADAANRLRRRRSGDYDRFSMTGTLANGKLPTAIIRPFAIVAPHAR
jgi:hypothetical protein